MPEDILHVEHFADMDITPEVLIPCEWGNEYGGGNYIPAYRVRHKGQKLFHWNIKTAKPLVWMPIPKLPTNKELEETARWFFNNEASEEIDWRVRDGVVKGENKLHKIIKQK